MPFFEVSCKMDINVEEAFQTLAKMIKERSKYTVNNMFVYIYKIIPLTEE